MTDTREKLIELLKKTPIAKINGHIAEAEVCFVSHVFESMADHLLTNGVTIQKWIPVSERLPEKSGEYLTLDDYGLRTVLEFSEVHQAFNASDYIPNDSEIHCTHWMPLPAPPSEVSP